MLMISNRAQNVIDSPIRKFLPKVLETEAKGIEVLKINVGDPDIETPRVFWEGLKAYKKPNIGYAPSTGIKEHVAAWIQYFKNQGIILEPKNIIPTTGCAEAISFAMMAVADMDEEIIVFEPLYTSYKGFAMMAGIKLIPVTLKIENNFALPNVEEIERKITSKTRAIVVVNPNNPTGSLLSAAEIKTIISVAVKHNLFIIADETYREIVFSGQPKSFLEFSEARENIIALDSISKKFSCPGVRIGCVASYNERFMKGVLKFAMIRLSAPTLGQYASMPLLRNSKNLIAGLVEEYRKRRDVVYSALTKMESVVAREPQGAFYIMARFPVEDAENFVKFLITDFSYNNKTVLITPAEDFYITKNAGRDEIRIAYVLSSGKLSEAMEVISRGLSAFRGYQHLYDYY